MATIRDVAKMAGVSVATVSRVMNQSGYVNKETEKQIKSCIEMLNYSPNTIARGLTRGKTGTIALILPDISNPFFPELAKCIEDAAYKLNYTIILANTDLNKDKEFQYVESFKNRYVDGIIFASYPLKTPEIASLNQSNMPIVVLDRAVGSEGIVSTVKVNNYRGAVLAMQHLIEIGCKKIAHISGPDGYLPAFERYKGYVETVGQAGSFHPDLIVKGDFSIESGLKAVYSLLQNHPDIDGIFAANDLMAIGCLKGLLRSGKKVPEDVALIGFDDISLAHIMEPEISTIQQPFAEIAQFAVQQLIQKIESNITPAVQANEVIELDVRLIQRASTQK